MTIVHDLYTPSHPGFPESSPLSHEVIRTPPTYSLLSDEEQQWARAQQVAFYEEQMPGSAKGVDPFAPDRFKERSIWRGFRDQNGELMVSARLLLAYAQRDKSDADFANLQADINDLDPSIVELLGEQGPAKVGEIATLKSHVQGETYALKLFAHLIQEAHQLDLTHIIFGLYPDRKKAMSRILGSILTPAGDHVRLGKFDIDFIPYVVDVEKANGLIERVQLETHGQLGVVALSKAARELK